MRTPGLAAEYGLARLAILAFAYFASGWLGLQMPYVGSHITLIWLPTGIAVAALLLWGLRTWPGVYVGAFLVNLTIGSSSLLAAGIAIGNTLGPILAAAWLRRLGIDPAFRRQKDVAYLIGAAAVGMLVSAGGGVTALHLAGLLPLTALGTAGLSWWMGDFVGVLLACPILLTLDRDSLVTIGRARREVVLWLLIAFPVGWLAFIHDYVSIGRSLPLAFLTLPMFAWAALRFGNPWAPITGLGFSVLAAWSTARGHGTFFLPDEHVTLLLLWSYMATTVLTGLLVTALLAERKSAEDILRESEERFRLLASATFEGIAFTRQGRFVDANEQCCAMLGYSRDELIGMEVADFLTPEDRQRVLSNIKGNRESHVEHAMICKGGRQIQVEAHGQNYQVGDQDIRITALRDMTARKRMETELSQYRDHLEDLVQQRTAALVETEARATHILHSSADGLYGVDSAGNITFINPAACALLGYSPDQVIGRSAHATFHHTRPDGTPYAIEDCPSHRAVTSGKHVRIDNEVYWHADGHPVPVMYAVHPTVQNELNSGAVVSFVDMSEQRAAAHAREQALVAAENLARMRSEFLANMSHEIRTPLFGVLGIAEIGYRNYENSEKARDAFAKIKASGKRLLGVINDILDFSKIEAGAMNIEWTEVSITTVVEDTLDLVRDRALAKGLALSVEIAENLPLTCISDPLRLGQILLNIVTNAIKFTEHGSISITVDRQEDWLIFRIADTGTGMTPTQVNDLFTPFRQGDTSASRKYGGTGLGLSICKLLLNLLGGSIVVRSELGAGTTVEFRIPYKPATEPQARPTSEAPQPPMPNSLAGITCLLAEDEPDNQAIIVDILRQAGAGVVVAGSGREAVDKTSQDAATFDIVLMDIQMPDMDGYEATRRIRAMAPDLPIIAQTAHAYAEERERCLAAGMVAHIAKPIDRDALVALILRHHRPRSPLPGSLPGNAPP